MHKSFYNALPDEAQPFRSLSEKVMQERLPVVLFGAGAIGQEVSDYLNLLTIPVRAIVDNDKKQQDREINGIRVTLPESQRGIATPAIICSDRFYPELRLQAEDLGLCPLPYIFFLPDHIGVERRLRLWEMISLRQKHASESGLLRLDSVDVVITERCSLRCEHCSNLMQYFVAPKKTELRELSVALKNLFSAVDYIYEMRILGGEPFIEKDFHKYIYEVTKYSSFNSIVVFTNGTIVPSGENLDVLRDGRITVSITDYNRPEQRLEDLVRVFKRNTVAYRLNPTGLWQDCATIAPHQRSIAENARVFEQCCVNHLLSLKNGELHRCPFSGSVSALSAVPADILHYVDLLNEMSDDERSMRISSLVAAQFLAVCDYCNGRPRGNTPLPAAGQIQSARPYARYGKKCASSKGKK